MTPRGMMLLSLLVCCGDLRFAAAQDEGEPPLPRPDYSSRAAFVAGEKPDGSGKKQPLREPTPTDEPELAQPPQANPSGETAAQLGETSAARESEADTAPTKSRS